MLLSWTRARLTMSTTWSMMGRRVAAWVAAFGTGLTTNTICGMGGMESTCHKLQYKLQSETAWAARSAGLCLAGAAAHRLLAGPGEVDFQDDLQSKKCMGSAQRSARVTTRGHSKQKMVFVRAFAPAASHPATLPQASCSCPTSSLRLSASEYTLTAVGSGLTGPRLQCRVGRQADRGSELPLRPGQPPQALGQLA